MNTLSTHDLILCEFIELNVEKNHISPQTIFLLIVYVEFNWCLIFINTLFNVNPTLSGKKKEGKIKFLKPLWSWHLMERILITTLCWKACKEK